MDDEEEPGSIIRCCWIIRPLVSTTLAKRICRHCHHPTSTRAVPQPQRDTEERRGEKIEGPHKERMRPKVDQQKVRTGEAERKTGATNQYYLVRGALMFSSPPHVRFVRFGRRLDIEHAYEKKPMNKLPESERARLDAERRQLIHDA